MKLIRLLLCFTLFITMMGCSSTTTNNEEKEEQEETIVETTDTIETLTIDELFSNGIDSYLGKTVTIIGYAPWQPVGTLAEITSEDWQNSIYVSNINETFGGGFEVTVTGEICFLKDMYLINCDHYSINESIVREDVGYDNTNVNEILTIDELFYNGIDNYLGKSLTIIGFAPWQPVGPLAEVTSEDWQYTIYADNVEEPIGGGFEVVVTGVLNKVSGLYIVDSEYYYANENIVRGAN